MVGGVRKVSYCQHFFLCFFFFFFSFLGCSESDSFSASIASRFLVCRVSALCPARNFSFTLEPDDKLCAHMIIVHVVLRLYTRCQRRLKKTESNKCSAVAMWMVRHKHSS